MSALDARVDALSRALVGRKVGLVRSLRAVPVGPDEGDVILGAAVLPNLAVLPGSGDILAAGGAGRDRNVAALTTLVEAVERYCGAFVDPLRAFRTRPLDDRFLRGVRFPLFAPWQYDQEGFPFRPVADDAEIRWQTARSLVTGAKVFVPAVLVHVPYRTHGPEEWLGPSTSTGMAAGFSRAEVTLTGLLEVCERDAFMITWLNRLSMPRLTVAPGTPLAVDVARARKRFGDLQVDFVDVTNDFRIPVVIAVVRSSRRGAPLVTVGAASRRTREGAARKALVEGLKERTRLRFVLERDDGWRPAQDYVNVTDFEWHSRVYAAPQMARELDFLTASEQCRSLEDDDPLPLDPGSALEEATRRVQARGEDVLVVDLTTREVAELGLSAVKVVVPGAVPMGPDHRYPWLGHRRIYRTPVAIGRRSRELQAGELFTALPHPFA